MSDIGFPLSEMATRYAFQHARLCLRSWGHASAIDATRKFILVWQRRTTARDGHCGLVRVGEVLACARKASMISHRHRCERALSLANPPIPPYAFSDFRLLPCAFRCLEPASCRFTRIPSLCRGGLNALEGSVCAASPRCQSWAAVQRRTHETILSGRQLKRWQPPGR